MEETVKHGIGQFLVAGSIVASSFGLTHLAQAADPFKLRSSAFEDNGKLVIKNAGNNKANPNCVGENVSPPLAWSNPPDGTKSFALLMYDPEGRGGLGVVHWVAYGIPASVTGFAEGEVSAASDKYVGGKSTPGLPHYSGPCTPAGDWHHYTFTLISTDLDPKALQPGMTREELFTALTGHTKGAAGLIGRFTHP
jgi:Raf kinase inhibitor-like YbhB/YbcL family protein